MPVAQRPYVPVVPTLVHPGLGHFSLRYWRRGLVWFVLYVL